MVTLGKACACNLKEFQFDPELRAKFDFWEIDSRVSQYYYEITKRNFVQVVVPQKIFSGAGYLPFSQDADLRASKGRWL